MEEALNHSAEKDAVIRIHRDRVSGSENLRGHACVD
jgi:hypothetical protein